MLNIFSRTKLLFCFLFVGISLSYADTSQTVNLGEEFTLSKGETAKVKNLNVTLKITGFINSPCPKGRQCFWSGLAVACDLTVNEKTYQGLLPVPSFPSEVPFEVLFKESDYETYATFVIIKPKKGLHKERQSPMRNSRQQNTSIEIK